LAKYIRDTQLQYASVNREQLHVVAEMLAQLNEVDARLGKNWLSRFLNRHLDLKTSRNRGLDSLESLVSELVVFEAGDPRDTIYALMSLA
jgi:hypothetical protein